MTRRSKPFFWPMRTMISGVLFPVQESAWLRVCFLNGGMIAHDMLMRTASKRSASDRSGAVSKWQVRPRPISALPA